MSAHEDLRREHEVKSSSDRSFALVFAGFFALITALHFWKTYRHPDGTAPFQSWSAIVAAVFLVIAFTVPSILAPLNKLWTKLGLLMGKVMAPIVLGLLLYVVVTPIALLVRVFGGDPLRLRLDKSAKSYWITREPPGPAPDTMSNQF